MATKPALLTLFTHRNPALLLSGQAISNFGDGVANVAFSLLVIDTTHSAAKLRWFTAARIIPMVLFVLVAVCAPGVLYVLLSPHVNSVDAQR